MTSTPSHSLAGITGRQTRIALTAIVALVVLATSCSPTVDADHPTNPPSTHGYSYDHDSHHD
ncbi:MAG TPA: hypothetical protein VH761_12120 [Ilumatobacteraceae bacterium]|jgi:hypothetical protein